MKSEGTKSSEPGTSDNKTFKTHFYVSSNPDFVLLSKYISETFKAQPPELNQLINDPPMLSKIAELISKVLLSKTVNSEICQVVELSIRHLINEMFLISQDEIVDSEIDNDNGSGNKYYITNFQNQHSQSTTNIVVSPKSPSPEKKLPLCASSSTEKLNVKNSIFNKYLANKNLLNDNIKGSNKNATDYDQNKKRDLTNSDKNIKRSVVFQGIPPPLSEEATEEIMTLKNRIRILNRKSNSLSLKLNVVQKEKDDQASLLNNELSNINLKYNESLKKLKFFEQQQASLEDQFNVVNNDAALLAADNQKLKLKYNNQKKKIMEIEKENINMRNQIIEFKAEISSLSIKLESLFREKDTEKGFISFDLQDPNLSNNNFQFLSPKTQKIKLNEEMKNTIQKKNNEIKDLNKKISALEIEISKLKGDLDCVNFEKNETENQKDKIFNQFIEQQTNCKNQIFQLKMKIKSLEDNSSYVPCPKLTFIQSNDSSKVQKLSAIINSYSIFIIKLFSDGEVKPDFLNTIFSKIDISQYRQKIEESISKSREFLSTNNITDYVPIYDQLFSDYETKSKNKDYIDPIYATFSSLINIFIKQNEELVLKLKNIQNLLMIECEEQDIPDKILDYHIQNEQKINELIEKLNEKYAFSCDRTNYFSKICGYVNESSQILRSIEDELYGITSFNGNIIDLPSHASQFIKKILLMLNEKQEEKLTYLNTPKISQKISPKNNMHSSSDDIERKKLDFKIQDLQDKLDNETDLKNDLKNAYDNLYIQNNEHKNEISSLMSEIKRLNNQLNQIKDIYKKELDESLDNTAKEHEKDIRRINERAKIQINLVKEKLQEKSQKLIYAKKEIQQLIDAAKNATAQHEKTVHNLLQQNSELVKKSDLKYSSSSFSSSSLEKNHFSLDNLDSSGNDNISFENKGNEILTERLLVMQHKLAEQIKKQQIEEDIVKSVGFLLDRCFKKKGNWNKKKVMAAVSSLIEKAIATENGIIESLI